MKLIKDKRTIRKYLNDKETVKSLVFHFVCPMSFTREFPPFFIAVFIPEKAKKENIGKYFAFDATKKLHNEYLDNISKLKKKHSALLKKESMAIFYCEEEAAKEVITKHYLK